jgi:hypothetical protein
MLHHGVTTLCFKSFHLLWKDYIFVYRLSCIVHTSDDTFSYLQGLSIDSCHDESGNSKPES